MSNTLKKLKFNKKAVTLAGVMCIGIFILISSAFAEDKQSAAPQYDSPARILISQICEDFGISESFDNLKETTSANYGKISFFDIKSALESKGLDVKGIKSEISDLGKLLEKGVVLTAVNRNSHFVTVLEINDIYVKLYDPTTKTDFVECPLTIFKDDWDGKVLLIKEKPVIVSGQEAYSEQIAAQSETVATETAPLESVAPQESAAIGETLSTEEMQAQATGSDCDNVDDGAGNLRDRLKTADPVVLSNGNLSSDETDFMIQTKGLVPLELKRVYNSQSNEPFSYDEWGPEQGGSTWRIVNGEYCGHGDRSVSSFSARNYTLTLRMKTINGITDQPWMTARVNFRWQGPNDTYYVLINRNGKVEVMRVKSGSYTLLGEKQTGFSPYDWNNVRIEMPVTTNGSQIKVYINNVLICDVFDSMFTEIPIGKIALEASYSHCHFDDINIDNISYDFDTPVRDEPFGMNWTFNYDVRLQHMPLPGGAPGAQMVKVIKGDDTRYVFTMEDPSISPVYKSPKGEYDILSTDGTSFTLKEKDGTKYYFNINGRFEYIEDRFNNRNTLYYETIYGKERLKRVSDFANRSLVFDYWENGKIKEVTAPDGRKYQYFYQDGQLTEVKDPRGNSKYYEYDPIDHARSKYTDREGNIYEYTYTGYNLKVKTQKDPDNNYTTFDYGWADTIVQNRYNEIWHYTFYNDNHMLQYTTDNFGAVTTYEWQKVPNDDPQKPPIAINNLLHIKDAAGRETLYDYDEKGNRKWMKDPELNITEFTYDPAYSQVTWKKDASTNQTTYIYDNGKLTEIHEPLSKTTIMEYYNDGKLKKITNANNNVTEYEYDTNGYTKKIKYYTETGVIEKNFIYDVVGNLQSETDEEGNTTIYVYDENNNLKEVRDGSNNILTSYTYDKNDNIKTITDALGHTVYQEYDWAGNLVKKTEYDEYNVPHTIEYTYDNVDYLHLGKSRITRVKDQEGNITSYQYSKEWNDGIYGILKTATDAEVRYTKYKYDILGNMKYIEDSASKKTKYDYNNNDKIKLITYPDYTSEEFHYTPVGDLNNKRDRMYRTTTFEYDALNRLRFKRYPVGNIEYQYDNLNLRHVITADSTTDFVYDKLNRLKDTSSPGGKVVAYEYYNNGLRKKFTYPDGTYITYHYDSLRRLIDIKDSSGSVIAHYDYDGLSSRRHGLSYANGASIEYAYDVLNRIKSMNNKTSSGDIFTQFDYTYDKVGNRKTMTTTEGLYGYTYDKTYQLKDVTYPDSRTAHYQYDNMGNRQYVDEIGEHWDYTLKTNGLNQYDTLRKTKHNIDVEGAVRGNNPTVTVNSVDGTMSGEGFLAEDVTLNTGANSILASATDPSGTLSDSITINLDTSNAKTFTYDGNGSITGISWNGEQTTYGYDYENRLISITETGKPNIAYKYDYVGRRIEKNVGGIITKYVYDGDNIIAEYDNAGNLIARYIYGPNIDEPIRLLTHK